uniref:Uncharacterized protein n=1 Tax=Arundo donax TaxID=35708 RepID=A0A0A9AQH2_ARUDO
MAAHPHGGGGEGASSQVGGDSSNSAPHADSNQDALEDDATASGATNRKRNPVRERGTEQGRRGRAVCGGGLGRRARRRRLQRRSAGGIGVLVGLR